MQISDNVAYFLEDNKDLIDNDMVELMVRAGHRLITPFLKELVQLLDTAGIPVKEYQLKAYSRIFLDSIAAFKDSFWDSKSHYWSRFQYIDDGITSVGLEYEDRKQYIIDNAKELGIEMIPLEDEYGWQGSGDYDLGWFNKKAYREEMRDNNL